jgi:NADPH-dependent F420 reductase
MPAPASTLPDVSAVTVGILGGTGRLGRGLAYRLARAGQRVLVGSRDVGRGIATAAGLMTLPGVVAGAVAGGGNQQAAAADVVIAALPYPDRAGTLNGLRSHLAGRIVIDCANPITRDASGHLRVLRTAAGSAAEQMTKLLPESRVVATFHQVSALLLADTTIAELGTDALVLSDDRHALALVQALVNRVGMRGVAVGGLRHARHVEHMAANLIAITAFEFDRPNQEMGERHGQAAMGAGTRDLGAQ